MQKLPLVLLHGALGSKTQFDSLIPHLSGDRTILTFNFPGHGGLPISAPFTIETFATAIIAQLDQHQIETADIFGYSMGGYAALQCALRHPDRIRCIMTLGTKFNWTPETATKEAAMMNPEKMEEKIPKFAQLLAERHQPQEWKEVVRQTAVMMNDLGNGQALTMKALGGIKCPVIISRGDLDQMVGQEESESAAAHLSKGAFLLLGNTKHPFEQVDMLMLALKIEHIL